MQNIEIDTLEAALQEIDRLKGKYEKEIRLASIHYDLLLETCSNMVFLFDEKLRFVNCSSTCVPLLSKENRAELKLSPFKEVFRDDIMKNWVQNMLSYHEKALNNLMPSAFDDTILFSDNHYINAQIDIFPIVDGQNKCTGTFMSINNVTELMTVKERAEQASRFKGTFLASMSHEIRTPMNAIKGLSELLSLTKLTGMQRNYVQNILSSINSLINVMNDVLDYTRIDANKIIILEGPYNVAELVMDVCSVVCMRAEESGLRFFTDISPNIPSVLIGDNVRIRQIMLNLLTNAVKYSTEGFIRFRLYTEALLGVMYLVCEVEDSGIGIHEEDIPNLFEAFSRMDSQRNKDISGSGLGLAISKRLVHAMDGEISVSSVYGQGSTFKFCVPHTAADETPLCVVNSPQEKQVLIFGERMQAEAAKKMLDDLNVPNNCLYEEDTLPALADKNYTHCIYFTGHRANPVAEIKKLLPDCKFATLRSMRTALNMAGEDETVLFAPLIITDLARFLNSGDEAQAGSHIHMDTNPPDDFTLRDSTLLVVDDNEINLMVSGEMLRLFGADVVLAGGGREALRLCYEQKFDIIFLDHIMPDMDGLAVAKELRDNCELNKATPIVALTANVEGSHMQNFYKRAGLDDFIGKPFEFSDLARILLRWLPDEKISIEA